MSEILPVPVQEAKTFYESVFRKDPKEAISIVKTYGKAYGDFYDACKSGSFREIYGAARSIEKAIQEIKLNPIVPEVRDLALKHFQLKSMLKNMKSDEPGKPTEKDIERLREDYHDRYGI